MRTQREQGGRRLDLGAAMHDLCRVTRAYSARQRVPNQRAWFSALYEVLLGQTQGPRFGSFVELYGIPETRALIRNALAG